MSRKNAKSTSPENLHRLFGWTSLLVWLIFGTTLEILHGFKVSSYLLSDIRREFWSLAHFHGVGLGIVSLIYVRWAQADGLTPSQQKTASYLLIAGSILMPLGFFLGGLVHYEGDPGIGIFLAPIGAFLILLVALFQTKAAWRGE